MPKTHSVASSAAALSALTSLGGIFGYARSGYLPSIPAGFTFGAFYLASFSLLRSGKRYGVELGVLTSLIFYGAAVLRAVKTRGKIAPVGLSVLAGYGLTVFGAAFMGKGA